MLRNIMERHVDEILQRACLGPRSLCGYSHTKNVRVKTLDIDTKFSRAK